MAVPPRGQILAHLVKAALCSSPRTSGFARSIDVGAQDGLVVLRGEVRRLSERGAAEVVARNLPGVTDVRNTLLVASEDRTDEEVHRTVFDAFIQDPYLDERLIQVSVRDGVVTLEGEVESLTHRRLAGGITWWVRGVRGVVNRLRTRELTTQELESNDDLLAAAIETLLDKDPLVDESEVTVIVRDGVAELIGTVCGPVERDAAEEDAWATLGVKDVRNELEIATSASPRGLSLHFA